LVPLTVSVNAASPAVLPVGKRLLTVGNGLLIVNVSGVLVPPPGIGLLTVTDLVPPTAIAAALMFALTCVESMSVVVCAVPPKSITEPLTNLVPVTVSVKPALPAMALSGPRLAIVGTTLLTVKVTGPVVPPPGAGLDTVTGIRPALARSAATI